MRYQTIITALLLALAVGVSATAQAKSVKTENAPKPLQKGTLANQKLQQDAMMGVAMKAGTMGCSKALCYPYAFGQSRFAQMAGNVGGSVRQAQIQRCD